MNLILFQPSELTSSSPPTATLPLADPRAEHLIKTLRRQLGDITDVGLLNGPRGKATLATVSPTHLTLAFTWDATPPPPLDPITLIIGLPRPQTARKILQEATTLGVSEIHFITTERGEPSYAQSTLWHSSEYHRHLLAGAEQAFCTRIPHVTHGRSLAEIVAALPAPPTRLALDNYEAPAHLAATLTQLLSSSPPSILPSSIVLALGPERGWTSPERTLLRSSHFQLAHLGPRVVRLETATVAAVAITKALRFSSA